MGRLDDRIAIVTGASRGIGAAIAKRLADEGATVAVAARSEQQVDDRLPGTIHTVVQEIEAAGGRALAVQTDMAKESDRARLVETVVNDLGPPDILVNNAAVTYFLPTTEFTRKRYDLMFEVQVWGAVDLARRVIPYMIDKKKGSILNISSKAAFHPQGPPFDARFSLATVYGMCKAALERLSTGLASEVYQHGISVNALSPAKVVPTPGVLFHGLISADSPDTEPVEVMAEAALTLVAGDPSELTGRICFSQDLLDEFGIEPRSPAKAVT
jgi:NAD(P)-dependent dehydrogenase (short-subunit alcohol dehydrogenase family)